ncbi:Alkaline phosphatase 4 [Ceratocystis fimbriata CBS 114723]|uniref:alkaline phosphatase n=1 Tax=Ceratocystis fimbriata CBS 114723 TaxID=1035309 RepID=A0A2C5X8D8_9PEZI|nr:Alkaline phosphatase 4 [Ceratocystis fimbriata CBS 114723]
MWQFGWFEDRFARAAESKNIVNVASKIYRRIHIKDPGEYEVTPTYYNGETTVANWVVHPISSDRKAKNVILFIGDGMTTSMITAARMLGHKSINGYTAIDSFPLPGHQMTHSIDTTMTDSANSGSALYSGHKGSARSMGGTATTANLNGGTLASLVSHTRSRSNYGPIIDHILNGITNWTWNEYVGPEAFPGGGAEAFLLGDISYLGQDYYTMPSRSLMRVVKKRVGTRDFS